jgi:hypothetical protein
MDLEFEGEIWFWKGPSPFWFVTVPDDLSRDLVGVSPIVSYGWGMIPVSVELGSTRWSTALWPKDGRYIVPLKIAVQRAESLRLGDSVALRLHVDLAAVEPPLAVPED